MKIPKLSGKFCLRVLAVALILNLNGLGFFTVSRALAYFTDQEMAQESSLTAGILDFSVTNQNVGGFIGIGLGEDKEFISVVTKTSGSMDIQYKARAEKISGNDDFCNALILEAFHSAISHDGSLLSFNTTTTTALGAWAFEVKLPHTASNFSHNEECNVDLVFEGWRDDVADFNQSGFNDEERIQLRLASRMVVLNEFLPRPDGWDYGFYFGGDSSDMPQGEWVELYNNSDNSFDLADWYIRDESATNKIMITSANTYPAGTVINGKSWLVVYMNTAVLNNTGDTVKLFDSADRLVDLYAYTTANDYCDIEPTPGDENSTETSGSCAGVPPNKSYARIPDGIGYWVDPIPTPGGPNSLQGENFVFGPAISEPGEETSTDSAVEEDLAVGIGALVQEIVEVASENQATTTMASIAESTTTEADLTIDIAQNQENNATSSGQVLTQPELLPETIVQEQAPAMEEQPVVLPEEEEFLDESGSSGDNSLSQELGQQQENDNKEDLSDVADQNEVQIQEEFIEQMEVPIAVEVL